MPNVIYLRLFLIKIKDVRFFLFYLLLSLFLFSCSGSKTYLKKGSQLETAGLTEEAANYYYMALQRNANNIDAKIFLKKTAQAVLDNKMADFYKAHGVENYKLSVSSYQEAIDFKQKMERFVTLDVAPYYESYFEESKKFYLEEQYQKANTLLNEGKFEQAEIVFKEIAALDPNYEDVKTLKKISEVEPLYNEGIELLNAKKYKQAYNNFNEVIQLKGAYKDAISFREQALENALLTIALLPVESVNQNVEKEITERYYSKILSELLREKNDFITVVDRVNTQKIIEEQKLGLTGLIDPSKAARTGELLGAKIVITARLLDVKFTEEPIKAFPQRGYQAFRVRKFNNIGKYYYYETGYNKVEYIDYYGKTDVSSTFEFQMISSETGEVLLSEIYNVSKNDVVNYSVFEGDHRMLYPGTWNHKSIASAEDQVYTSTAQKQMLDRKLSSRKRTLKTGVELKTEIVEEIAEKVASKIMNYEKQRD